MREIPVDLFAKVNYASHLKSRKDYLSYVVSHGDMKDNDYKSDIYLYNKNSKKSFRLTNSNAKSYEWFNDEEILFVSTKEKFDYPNTRFDKISILGGESEEFFSLPYSITSTKLYDNYLYFTASYIEEMDKIRTLSEDEKKKYLEELKEKEAYDTLEHIPFWLNGAGYLKGAINRLYRYSFETKEVEELTADNFNVSVFKISEEGKIVLIGNEFKTKMEKYNKMFILDDKLVEVGFKEDYSYHNFAFLNEEELIVSGAKGDQYGINENPKFSLLNIKTNEIQIITPDFEDSASLFIGTDLSLYSNLNSLQQYKDGIIVPVLNNFYVDLMLLRKDGSMELIKKIEGSMTEYIYDEQFYFISMINNELQEVYDENFNKITQLNEEYEFIKPEHFIYTNKDGMELDGFIIKPEIEGKLPTILDIHGGPKTVYGDVVYHEMQYWASKGYIVIFTNPRGSDGKGNAFADIRGKYGTIDYDDLMVFVDTCIEKYPEIDADRMGVTGGSYGGFMTNWIVGHTNRFKCAATQRSISNWTSFFGTSDIGYYFAKDQMGSDPWENFEAVWNQSPIKYADQMKTPTLVIHSYEDYRCPTPCGYQMFVALKYFGIDTKMVIFKGETHELSRSGKPKNRVKRLSEITEWMDKYLK